RCPAATHIPLVGDATRLWTTDDAASELPALGVACDSCAGEGCGDSLMHGELLRLGTNGNLELIPQMGENSREFGGLVGVNRLYLGRERLLEVWVLALSLSAAGACVGLIASGYRIQQPSALAVLAALALAADYGSIRLSPLHEVTIASLVCVFAAVVLGPLSGAVVATAGLLRDLPRRDTEQPILRWATWTSKRILATVGAGLTAGVVMTHAGRGFLGLFLAVTAAFVVETIVGDTLALIAPAIRQTSSMRATFRDIVPSDIVSVPSHVPTAS